VSPLFVETVIVSLKTQSGCRPCLGDEMCHYADEECNETYETSPTASRHAKWRLYHKG